MNSSLDFEEARRIWRIFDSILDYCNCPSEGSFIGWEGTVVLHDYRHDGGDVQTECCLVKLLIPEDSPRLRAKNSKKCRCKFAKVLDIQRRDGNSFPIGTVAYSFHEMNDSYPFDPAYYRTHYKKGKKVYADSFDEDREHECSHGIHFFMHRGDAAAYIGW